MLADVKRFIANGSHFRLLSYEYFFCPQRYFTPTGRDVYFLYRANIVCRCAKIYPHWFAFSFVRKIIIQTNREINKVKGKGKEKKKKEKKEKEEERSIQTNREINKVKIKKTEKKKKEKKKKKKEKKRKRKKEKKRKRKRENRKK